MFAQAQKKPLEISSSSICKSGTRSAIFNLLPSLGVVKAPVLVIHGVADPIPVEASEAWTTAMPNARLLLIKDAGHIPQIEQPEIFFKSVETFLKGNFPADAKKVKISTEKS